MKLFCVNNKQGTCRLLAVKRGAGVTCRITALFDGKLINESRSRMRITFLLSSLEAGGSERVAATLCNTWAARGDRVTLVATYSGGGQGKLFYEMSPAVEIVFLANTLNASRNKFVGYVQRMRALRKLIIDREPDVIVSFLPNVNLSALVSSAFLGTPVIISERSDPSVYPFPWYAKLLCRWSYRFADVLAVQTESVATKAWHIYPGLKKVCAIPNPLPRAMEDVSAAPMRARKVLLSLGRLSPEKQVGTLLQAFVGIASQFPDWDLHIYGDGPDKAMLEEHVRCERMDGRVLLKGPTATPWEVMANADVFAMVSAYEGFPNALLEAMAVGLPCVVFDCPSGPREISCDGRNAMLVPLNDQARLREALISLMEDGDLRSTLGKRAREFVRSRFSLPNVASQWDELFMQVGALKAAPIPAGMTTVLHEATASAREVHSYGPTSGV